jgi:hypothetical protein
MPCCNWDLFPCNACQCHYSLLKLAVPLCMYAEDWVQVT